MILSEALILPVYCSFKHSKW